MSTDECWTAKKLTKLGLAWALGIPLFIMGVQKIFSFSSFIDQVKGLVPWVGSLAVLVALIVMVAEVVFGAGLILFKYPKYMFFGALMTLVVINLGLMLSGDQSMQGMVPTNLIWILVAAFGLSKCCSTCTTEPVKATRKKSKK